MVPGAARNFQRRPWRRRVGSSSAAQNNPQNRPSYHPPPHSPPILPYYPPPSRLFIRPNPPLVSLIIVAFLQGVRQRCEHIRLHLPPLEVVYVVALFLGGRPRQKIYRQIPSDYHCHAPCHPPAISPDHPEIDRKSPRNPLQSLLRRHDSTIRQIPSYYHCHPPCHPVAIPIAILLPAGRRREGGG